MFGKNRNFKNSGNRIAWMKLKHQITQSLIIHQTKTTIYVKHINQLLTCNKCGSVRHKVRQCNVEPSDYKPIIDKNSNDSIELESNNEDYDNDNENNSVSGKIENEEVFGSDSMDIHMDPSQNTNILLSAM